MTDRAPGRALLWLLGFAVLAVLLTWPAVVPDGSAVSARGDYLINLWNFWWMDSALEQGSSPFTTDRLYAPEGISLARHTLSPANALLGGRLARSFGGHDAFKLMLVAHFALSAWVFFLLARELVGCAQGAALGAVLWSWSPYHAYYMAQINVASLEGLPLALLFMVRCWRHGGVANAVGVALSAGLLAATSSYYLVYAALLGGLLLAGGRFVVPEVPWRRGALRLALAGAAAGVVVAVVAWPLVSALLGVGGGGEAITGEAVTGGARRQALRSNDLLGFSWVGPPERLVVSWPTMFGFTTLAVLVAGWRALRGRLAWVAAAAFFFVLGLGPELQVGGEATGVTLPGAWLVDLPVFAMLRKPDRFFLLVNLFVALLLAAAWAGLAARLTAPRRRALWGVAFALLCLELSLAPLTTLDVSRSPLLADIAAGDARSLVDLPYSGGSPYEARANHAQTLHGKAIPGGYVTNLALTDAHRATAERWREADAALDRGQAGPLVALAAEQDIELLVLHKTEPKPRRPDAGDRVVWAPFALVRDELVTMRQLGHLEERPVPRGALQKRRRALVRAVGEPVLEDELLAVFDTRPAAGDR